METATDRQEKVPWWRQSVLREAHIAVIGAGALGNEVLKNLALMGAGNLYIFDFDRIELSNLSRTVLFSQTEIGNSKAAVAATSAKKLNVNPDAQIRGYNLDVVWELGGGVIRRMDIVLGCLDNIEARLAIGNHCYSFGIPYIDGGMHELDGRVQLHLTNFGACMNCAIPSWERHALRTRYSCLNVMKTRLQQGLLPTVQITSALVAAVMCQEAIKHLHGLPVSFGCVLTWSGTKNSFDVLRLLRRENCDTCSVSPRRILELPLHVTNSAADVLRAVGDKWQVHLPSSFVLRVHCHQCGRNVDVYRPSFRCSDADLACCGSSGSIDLSAVATLDKHTDPVILSLSLAELGLPPLTTFYLTSGDDVVLAELAADQVWLKGEQMARGVKAL